ncbi:MAG: serine/threonine protein kinase [Archangium sp.]|nr:serine/threonine protein kinase [Archangium sp.]
MAERERVSDPLIGMQLGDYVIEEVVGRGGMGIVYRAVHPLIGRKVAIKVLRPEIAEDPEQASRFLKEAQALSAVKHRGVIDIISFGKLPDGRQYMVMEFLKGESLDGVVAREAPLSVSRAMGFIDEVLDALSAAHKAGVVHRDIKPANVFLLLQSNGTRVVKLVDFGLARQAPLGDLSRPGARTSLMAGTPEYFSPEQARGLAATPRSDLYAVGVMTFELLTGRLPFEAESPVKLLELHLKKEPPRASSFMGSVPASVDALIESLLAKDPAERPRSADLARTAVQRIIRELRTQETSVAAPPLAARREAAAPHTDRVAVKKSRAPLMAALAVALVAVVGAVGWRSLTPTPTPLPEGEGVIVEPPPPVVELPVVDQPTPEQPEEPEELTPIGAVAAKKKQPVVRPKPPAFTPPSYCQAATWKDSLREKVGESQQTARAKNKLTNEAEAQLKGIHVAIRDGSKDCASLAKELTQWNTRFLQ